MDIEVAALRKEYGELLAVNDVSFRLPRGAILALIGPNGAGKTTLMKMMAALLSPTSGTVRVGDVDGTRDPKGLHRVIGFLPDFFGLYDDLTVSEYLEYFARAYGLKPGERESRVKDAIHAVGLDAKTNESLQNLSRGMRQRAGIARCLVNDPPVILLDEPASGLDPEARHELQTLFLELSKRGKTLIVSSHILTELEEYSSHVAMMSKGELRAFGSVQDVRVGAARGRKIVAEVLGQAAEATETLARFPQVSNVHIESDRRIRFSFSGDDSLLSGVLKALVQTDLAVVSFTEDENRIQDAYLSVMKGTTE